MPPGCLVWGGLRRGVSIMESWGGGVKGLIVEGMPCSSLSSIKVFPNCQGGWCGWTLTQPQLGNTSLHSTGARVMLRFGACRVDDVLFSVCKLFAKCIFFLLSISPPLLVLQL